eukprot:CAMPEP_0116149090 /NCGR_PEP_ID=MMETSP0329-20121206/18737_1 /TAXON_ID=697910 /ORGANISM="Pseudo-nitzschia arenysensis, Strain B593" /LENGTH=720 /DNA_ID=CAMNT_0003645331 /DNA_START=144 /DNA_END=2306 /DNA_ORIENTATION=-
MASEDDVNTNNGDCCKSVTGTRNRSVAQEERINNAEAGVAVVDSSPDIGFQKDSKLKASLYPPVQEIDCKSAFVDVDIEKGVARGANVKTEARISSPSLLSTITSHPESNCKTNYAVASLYNRNRSENHDDSSSDSDSSSKQQNNILRTTPGAFAINNPLSSSSSGNRPLLEQRPSLRIFASSVRSAAPAATEQIHHSEEGILLENETSNSLEGSNQQQDLQDDLADPETTTESVVMAAAATPCLSAIRVGSEFEVYEGEIVGEEIDEKVDTSPLKRKRKYFVGSCFVIWIAIAVVLVVLFSAQKEHSDVTKSTSSGNAEHSHTQGTIDNNISGVIFSPSGVIISSNPDPESKRRRDYLLSLLGPMSDRSGKDTSMDRISALTWMVDDLAGVVVFDESSSSPHVSIPEWKIFQRYILALLYFATAGEGWDIQSNFLSTEHECSWSEATPLEWVSKDPILDSSNDVIGVSCNENGRVQGLKLRWNDLAGTLPHELSYFKDTLEELDLGGGSISGTIPSSFTELTKLKTLGLNDNCLSGTIPEGLSVELQLLERFNIINNGDLYGSLNNYCSKNEYANDGIFAIATECPLPSMVGDDDLEHLNDSYTGVECDCCICCDRNNYDCYNQHTAQSWKSVNLNAKMMFIEFSKQFDRKKECRTEANKEWISEKCSWYVNTTDNHAPDNNTDGAEIDAHKIYSSFECAVDGSQAGSRHSIGEFYWWY